MKQLNEKEIIVGPVRVSYLSVFETKRNDQKNNGQGADEYSVTLLFPKDDGQFQPQSSNEIAEVQKAIRVVKDAKFGPDFKGVWSPAIKDGDKEVRKSDGEPKHPGYWYMNVSAKAEYAPKLLDGKMAPARKADWASGDWGLVKVSLFAYDTAGNKGVSAGLRGIQFLYKDEPMGGGSAADEGFGQVANAHVGRPTASAAAADEYDPFADE